MNTLPTEVRTIARDQKIAGPGVYEIDIDFYHGDCTEGPGVSSSGLRTVFVRSPAHYWDESYLNPKRNEPAEKEAYVFGRASHHLFLGESNFRKKFVERPETIEGSAWHGNRTACKAWIAEQQLAGLTVLKPEQMKHIRGMGASLAETPLVQAGILSGAIERSIVYRDKETGIWIKVRPDAIPADSLDFADLKTTTDASPDAISKTIGAFRYDMQGALVRMAVREVLGLEMNSFSLVFVEKTPPYCTFVATLAPEDLDAGEADIRIALRTVARCLETGRWPGPGGTQADAAIIHVPKWARERALDRRYFLATELNHQ